MIKLGNDVQAAFPCCFFVFRRYISGMNENYKKVLSYLCNSKGKHELTKLFSDLKEMKSTQILSHIKYMQEFGAVDLNDKYVELNAGMENLCPLLLQDMPDKEKVYRLCIQHIEEENSVNTHWAWSIVSGENKSQEYHLHNRLSARLTESNKYVREKTKEGYDIIKNQNYELSEITKRTSIVQRNVLRITLIFSFVTIVIQGANLWITLSNQEKQKSLQEQVNNLKPPTIIIDSVVVHHYSSIDSAKK
jgi:hypothetical protein